MSETIGESTVEVDVKVIDHTNTLGENEDALSGYVHSPFAKKHVNFPKRFRWCYNHPTMEVKAVAVVDGLSSPYFVAYYETDNGASYTVRRHFDDKTKGESKGHSLESFIEEHENVLWTVDGGVEDE